MSLRKSIVPEDGATKQQKSNRKVTNVINMAMPPTNEGGWIFLKLVAIWLRPTIHFGR